MSDTLESFGLVLLGIFYGNRLTHAIPNLRGRLPTSLPIACNVVRLLSGLTSRRLLELPSQGTSVLQKTPIVGKFLHGRRICFICFRNVDAAPVLSDAVVAGRKHEARLLPRRRHRYGHVYEVGGSRVG